MATPIGNDGKPSKGGPLSNCNVIGRFGAALGHSHLHALCRISRNLVLTFSDELRAYPMGIRREH